MVVLKNFIFTSESVLEGHPDKVSDQIADAVLDAYLAKDIYTRCSINVMLAKNTVIVAGQITSTANVDVELIVRQTIKDIGYVSEEMGLDFSTCKIFQFINSQSNEIASAVNQTSLKQLGAGDQGMMFGYAISETPSFMPLSIDLAHKLAIEMVKVRKKNIIPFLRPDGKTQVSLQYENNKVKRVDSIIISQQHDKAITSKDLYSLIHDEVIKKVIPLSLIDSNTRILINPSGSFICGGTTADTGLTGRKIIVDTYGGHVNHGGGAFSGKDPTKVDRSAAYALRYIAKHIIAADFAEKILLQAAYVIGKAEPLSFFIDTFGTEKIKLSKIEFVIHKFFDLKVGSIINQLDLLKPIYKKSATFGHFGRSEFPWEKLNLINLIKDFNFD